MAAVAPYFEESEVMLPPEEQKTALTPPTSEEWNNKIEDSLSDILSNPETEDDEIEDEIEPDHYYEGGKIPVFKPTMDQFRSFKSYIEKIDKYGMKSGIVKVIPPQEWRESLPVLEEAVKNIKVKNPITQEFSGTHGTYTQANIEKQRSYNLPQWKALTDEPQHQPPARRGEKRKNAEKAKPAIRFRPTPSIALIPAQPPDETAAGRRRPGRPRKSGLPLPTPLSTEQVHTSTEDDNPQAPPTPTSPDSIPPFVEKSKRKRGNTRTVRIKQEDDMEHLKAQKAKSGTGGRASTISERRKYNRQEKTEQIDEAAFEDFDYRFNADEFTAERCNELETQYWKSLTFAPPMYGADMPGSLFDDSTTSWNVAKLENLLDVLGQKVPGVNTAYLYLGMWKATFAWHLEDVDLYSINYIHFGAPKQWYSISQEDARRFENAMKSVWPNDAKNCSQFLRHKTYLISPALLKSQYNIEVNKLVHYEGEFVITYPYGYHSGYNLGYNCAESVNFATEQWLEYGKIAKKCDCEADSVWINVDDIERKLRGESTPEYDEVTDDDGDIEEMITDLPSPPASVAGKLKQSRKRKRDAGAIQMSQQPKIKRIKLRIRTTNFEPCVLCPNNVLIEPLLPTDTGKHAHRACALYTPETYMSEENGVETVLGIANIDKARLDLKCSFCRSKKGACFQCSSRKCIRAFHATCAAPAGILVDYGPTPVYGEDGTEYVSAGYDFRCKFHRAKRPKHVTPEALESSSMIKRFARGLKKNDTVQIQYMQGEIFAGTVVENRPSERTVVISILPHGDQVEVEWKWLTILDPADSQLPKPTVDAKPLPAHLTGQIATSRNLEFGPPLPGDHFLDPASEHKWAEYHTAPAPHNPFQAKVDFDKKNQVWFYLGTTSTEARAQYTEDHANERFNSAGNFLDTVKPTAQPQAPAQRRQLSANRHNRVNYHAQNAAMVHARQQSVSHDDMQPRPYHYKPKLENNPNFVMQQQFLSNGLPHSLFPPNPSLQGCWDQTSLMHSQPDSSSVLGSLQTGGSWLDTKSFQCRQSLQHPVHSSAIKSPSRTAQQVESATTAQSMYNASPYSTLGQSWDEQACTKTAPIWAQAAPQATMSQMAPAANVSAPTANMSSTLSTGMSEDTEKPMETGRDYDFVQRIQSYKYLLNSYFRRPKVYQSPYSSDGGFSDEYNKVVTKPGHMATPTASHYQECALPLPALKQIKSFAKPQESLLTFSHELYPQSQHPQSQHRQYQTHQPFEQQAKGAFNPDQMIGTNYGRMFEQNAASVDGFEPSTGHGNSYEQVSTIAMAQAQSQSHLGNIVLVEPAKLTLKYQ